MKLARVLVFLSAAGLAGAGLPDLPAKAHAPQASFQDPGEGKRVEVWSSRYTGRYLTVFSGTTATVYRMVEKEPGDLIRTPKGALLLSADDLKGLDAWLDQLRKTPSLTGSNKSVELWEGDRQVSKELMDDRGDESMPGLLTLDALLDRIDPVVEQASVVEDHGDRPAEPPTAFEPPVELIHCFDEPDTTPWPQLPELAAGERVEMVIDVSSTTEVKPGIYSFTFSPGKVDILRGRGEPGDPVIWSPLGSVVPAPDLLQRVNGRFHHLRTHIESFFSRDDDFIQVSVWKNGTLGWRRNLNTAAVWAAAQDANPFRELIRKVESQ